MEPGCTIDVSWPPGYDDIYYGEDNCLYDADGKSMRNFSVDRRLLPKRFLTFRCLLQGIASTACIVFVTGRWLSQYPILTCDDSTNEARRLARSMECREEWHDSPLVFWSPALTSRDVGYRYYRSAVVSYCDRIDQALDSLYILTS